MSSNPTDSSSANRQVLREGPVQLFKPRPSSSLCCCCPISGGAWENKYARLYTDSTLALFKKQGDSRPTEEIPLKRVRLIYTGATTDRMPMDRPDLPSGTSLQCLLGVGMNPQASKINWILFPSEKVLGQWIRAILTTLPKPPAQNDQQAPTNANVPPATPSPTTNGLPPPPQQQQKDPQPTTVINVINNYYTSNNDDDDNNAMTQNADFGVKKAARGSTDFSNGTGNYIGGSSGDKFDTEESAGMDSDLELTPEERAWIAADLPTHNQTAGSAQAKEEGALTPKAELALELTPEEAAWIADDLAAHQTAASATDEEDDSTTDEEGSVTEEEEISVATERIEKA